MKNKVLDFSAFAVALIIIAILFSACSSGKAPVDAGENTDDPEIVVNEIDEADNTYNQLAPFEYYDCFIARDPYLYPDDLEWHDSYDCIPGYVYFEKEVYGRVRLLFDKKLKLQFYEDVKDKIYVVTEDNELVEINKADRSYETVYKAQYGDIDDFSFDYDNTYMFLTDGDYIVRFNQKTKESKVITKIEKSRDRNDIIPGRNFFKRDHLFYCDKCFGTDECFIWRNSEYECYWYHPETGESEFIGDLDNIWWGEPGVDYPSNG